MFTHLHNHSFFSLMDGLCSPEEMAKTAVDLGQTAISITDHGTISGHRDMQVACKEAGIKPILGVEAYISATDRFDRRAVAKRDDNTSLYNHIILLAKNNEGLKNIRSMSKTAWEEGFYYKPRIDLDLLEEFGDGVIVLSGCMNGLSSKFFLNDDPKRATEFHQRLSDRFSGDYYIELQNHNPPELNQFLSDLGTSTGTLCVTTSDCHFTRPELKEIEEALLILSTSPNKEDVDYDVIKELDILERFNTLYPDRPISFKDIDVFMQSEEEVLVECVYPDSVENTQDIVNKVQDYDFVENKNFLPLFVKNGQEQLSSDVMAGLRRLGLHDKPEYRERALSELEVIDKKDFSQYFLIVADLISYARSIGIRVGPGRGSSAGSLICYALGITEVDPIEHGLLFSRFIDASRSDWPDIDIDVMRSRRGELKEYLKKKYGHVASISNNIYFGEKNVIRDAARALDVPLADVNKVLKVVETFEEFETSMSSLDFRKKYPEVLKLAKALKGRLRSAGLHAAGVVVSSVPLEDFAPIESRSDPQDKVSGRIPVVAWDMRQCEATGLQKIDLLGLNTLDVIDIAVKSINDRHGVDADAMMSTYDDPQVLKMMNDGMTSGVFQADAGPSRRLLLDLGVNHFNDLVIATSLVRPGAMNTVGVPLINRKKGNEKVTFLHDVMKDITADTYGLVVFQEQVMRASTDLGGLSDAESNKLRKIIGKKQDVSEFNAYRDKFVRGATQHVTLDEAESLWHDFEAHAGYSFNKSHAVAYSMLTYQTAWLKCHYPLEYLHAWLCAEENLAKRTEIFIEMKRMGIKLLGPHINKSGELPSIDGDSIRLGLTNIKYISDKVCKNISKHAPYKSYEHVLEVSGMKGSGINSRAVDAMDKIGALKFSDNENSEDLSEYLWEYLNIPVFDKGSIPPYAFAWMSTCENLNEYGGAHIIRAVVTKTKRGKGWTLVEMLDETGSFGAFDVEDSTIKKGDLYVFLVADSSIVNYIPLSDFDSDDGILTKYLTKNINIDEDKYVVVGRRYRKTRGGQMMGTLVVADSSKELTSMVVFNAQFQKFWSKLQEGSVREIAWGHTREGEPMLTGVY